jgi:IPT/TIG domain
MKLPRPSRCPTALAALLAGLLLVGIPILAPPAAAAAPAPVVTGVCRPGLPMPGCMLGPASGGYEVTISGSNLTGATAVSFGGIAATSFTIGDSGSQISAVVPRSTLPVWRDQGVSVRVTTPSGRSPACRVLQKGCPAAFFYAGSTSLTGSGKKFRHRFSGSVGSVTYSGSVAIASWSLSGSAEVSGNIAPEAVLASGKLSVTGLIADVTASGALSAELKIKLPISGLPSIVGVYLRLVPGVKGTATATDTITKDTLSFELGWVNGTGYDDRTVSCTSSGCLGSPALTWRNLSGSLIVGPWLQIGPRALNVGAGPAVGLYRDSGHAFDACAGIQAEVNVEALRVKDTYNIYGPVNIKGTFAKCPLAAT